MARPSQNKWVLHQVLVTPPKEDCYIFKRPESARWHYFLSIPGEGVERKSTGVQGAKDDIELGQSEAIEVALDRKLEVMARQKQGLKAKRVKKMFDFMEEFLEKEQQRISSFNEKDKITYETWRIKKHHLNLFRKYYSNRNIKLEDIDYKFIKKYPTWRQKTKCKEHNPIPCTPPKTNSTISAELVTFNAYFSYLEEEGYLSRLPTFEKVTRESFRHFRRDYLTLREYSSTRNTLRAWTKRASTPTQTYNRNLLYNCILITANSCLRPGEIKKIQWRDVQPHEQITKEEQRRHHLIKIRKEVSKTGYPRTVQSPTVEYFNRMREIAGIPKLPKSDFPHVPPEYLHYPVFSKYNHHEEPFGYGCWNKYWIDIKELCAKWWKGKNITWYSFRHTGISFACSREVPILTVSKDVGADIKYVANVYYHHEAESKATWETLNMNREWNKKLTNEGDRVLVNLDDYDLAKNLT